MRQSPRPDPLLRVAAIDRGTVREPREEADEVDDHCVQQQVTGRDIRRSKTSATHIIHEHNKLFSSPVILTPFRDTPKNHRFLTWPDVPLDASVDLTEVRRCVNTVSLLDIRATRRSSCS